GRRACGSGRRGLPRLWPGEDGPAGQRFPCSAAALPDSGAGGALGARTPGATPGRWTVFERTALTHRSLVTRPVKVLSLPCVGVSMTVYRRRGRCRRQDG